MALSSDYNTFNDIPKPGLPYVEGYEFSVIEHFPPEPLITSFILTPDEATKRENIDVLTRCLTRNPIPGRRGSRCLRLKIREAIRVGDEKTSQIVLVDVISGQLSSTRVVAKLYDPLYYGHSNDDVDPFIWVDVEYTRESAAYRYLHGHGQKCGSIPDYYGSYSMDIRHSDHQVRTVRLILLEHISGHPLTTLHPSDFPDSFWKAVMKQIVDVESQLYQINLRHGDTHPRNVMIQGDKIDPSEPHVKFIDFGHASVGRSPNPQNSDQETRFLPGVYISPLLRWFQSRGREPVCHFEEWINWNWNEWLLGAYRSDKESITPEMIRKWLPASMRQQFQSLIEPR
ncbi:hypothetical protein BO78DRAFT_139100 [Aspergillus sclerotiicarbonarius CBS 121057]|uniref:Protein kinase domain-containing protein n=1 Tax=Aspergillus sclerotiicarbonarius (strain CBS 121057 / IBT 28362) TaxID=1448318 RepID=A0A319E7Y5_ASPSB|nr:hypothetical protein BO78DRAFT_139100 [Aspergillus sclerotiicarbonarius CBS 121057]